MPTEPSQAPPWDKERCPGANLSLPFESPGSEVIAAGPAKIPNVGKGPSSLPKSLGESAYQGLSAGTPEPLEYGMGKLCFCRAQSPGGEEPKA